MYTYATENKNNQIKSKRELAAMREQTRGRGTDLRTEREPFFKVDWEAAITMRVENIKGKKKKTQVYKNILSTAGANDNGLLLFSSRREFISLSEGQCQLGKPTTNAAVPPSPL